MFRGAKIKRAIFILIFQAIIDYRSTTVYALINICIYSQFWGKGDGVQIHGPSRCVSWLRETLPCPLINSIACHSFSLSVLLLLSSHLSLPVRLPLAVGSPIPQESPTLPSSDVFAPLSGPALLVPRSVFSRSPRDRSARGPGCFSPVSLPYGLELCCFSSREQHYPWLRLRRRFFVSRITTGLWRRPLSYEVISKPPKHALCLSSLYWTALLLCQGCASHEA